MTRAEIELMKRQIEAQIADYERAAAEALKWHQDWRGRNPPREAAE